MIFKTANPKSINPKEAHTCVISVSVSVHDGPLFFLSRPSCSPPSRKGEKKATRLILGPGKVLPPHKNMLTCLKKKTLSPNEPDPFNFDIHEKLM